MTIRRRSFDGRRPIGPEVRRGNEPALGQAEQEQAQAEGLVPLVRGTQRGQQPHDMVPGRGKGRGKGRGMAGNPGSRPYRLGLGMGLVPRNLGMLGNLPP